MNIYKKLRNRIESFLDAFLDLVSPIQLNFELSGAMARHLEEVRLKAGLKSLVVLLKHALALYDLVTEIALEGGKIFLREKNGMREELDLFPIEPCRLEAEGPETWTPDVNVKLVISVRRRILKAFHLLSQRSEKTRSEVLRSALALYDAVTEAVYDSGCVFEIQDSDGEVTILTKI